jgi:pyruvate carboxylase
VRLRYAGFDTGLKVPVNVITGMRSPGGQYTNLHPQVVSGLGQPLREVKEMYGRQRYAGRHRQGHAVVQNGGRPGDFHGADSLTPETSWNGARRFLPDSVVSYFRA